DSLVVEGLSVNSVISLVTVHLNAPSRTTDGHSIGDPRPRGNRVKYRSSASVWSIEATPDVVALEVWSSGWGGVLIIPIITICTDTTRLFDPHNQTHSAHSAHSVQVSGTGTRRVPANNTLRVGPSTQLTQGRVYAIGGVSAPEVVADVETPGSTADTSVARGTILIFNTLANVLFDTGASHSFISSALASCLGLKVDILGTPIVTTTPIGGRAILRHVCHSCEVGVAGHTLTFSFIVLGMSDFDVILGTDWLTAYRANIDCYRRRVTLCTSEGDRFHFLYDRGDDVVKALYRLHGQKVSFLFSLTLADKGTVSPKDITSGSVRVS
ncbi:hypothetical protein Dimus_009573, partial [Dionaea muscipula]